MPILQTYNNHDKLNLMTILYSNNLLYILLYDSEAYVNSNKIQNHLYKLQLVCI